MTTALFNSLIYLSGFIITYILVRYYSRKEEKEKYDWKSVKVCFILSAFSYIGLVVSIIVIIDHKYGEKIKKFFKPRPPKWL